MSKIINKIVEDLNDKGFLSKHHKCIYLLNYFFSFEEHDFSFTETHINYAEEKLLEYKEDIQTAISKISDNIYTRQSCISFDIKSSKPNCMLSIQIQIREKKLYCTIYQRSLDVVNKLPQDYLIAYRICRLVSEKHGFISGYNFTFFVGNIHLYI